MSNIKFTDIPGFKHTHTVRAQGVENSFSRHAHSRLCLVSIDAGQRQISIDGQTAVLKAGKMVAICPGQSHQSITLETENYRVVSFGNDLFDIPLGKFALPLPEDQTLRENFEQLFAALDQGQNEATLQNRTINLLAALLKYQDSTPPKALGPEHSIVKKAKNLIERNPEQNITLATLSGLTNSSPFYLQRLFLAQTGQTPHEYQLCRRIKNVCRQLLEKQPPSQVAIQNGFTDQSHLNRVFKTFTGTTPARFVKDNKPELK